MKSHYYDRGTDTCYSYNKETGLPVKKSTFEICLKFVLRLAHSVVRMASVVCEGISVRCLKHRHMPE